MSYMEPLFVVVKIIGSPGKNDSLLFQSNCFKQRRIQEGSLEQLPPKTAVASR